MARLPIPGSDDGRWGDVLNKYLSVALESNGALKGDIPQHKIQNLSNDLEHGKSAKNELSSHVSESNPHGISKDHVGLNNVDNTPDTDKPVSTPMQTELDKKSDSLSTTRISRGSTSRPTWKVISDFQSGHGWIKNSTGGTASDDSSTYAKGTQSLRLTTPGTAGGSVFIEKHGSWDFSDAEWQLLIRTEDYSRIQDAGIWLDFADTSSTNLFRLDVAFEPRTLRTGDWEVVTVSKANVRSTYGSPSWDNIEKIRLRINGTAAGSTNIWLGGISWRKAPRSGVVSISFDDGWLTDFTNARTVMDSFGFRGTAYVIADKIGTPNRTSMPQLQTLQNIHDWDISCHGSPDLTTLDKDQLRNEFSTIKQTLHDNGLSRGADHYALPMGRYNSLVQSVLKEYFESARTIDIQHETVVPGDNYRLRILNIFAWTATSVVQEAITKAMANKSWLILVYHRIVPGVATLAEEVSIDNFTQNMADLYNSGAEVRTIREVIEEGSELYSAKAEMANTSEVNTGTDTSKAVTPGGLAGSNFGKRVVQIQVTDPNGSAISAGDGQAYFTVPTELNGMSLVDADASITTVSSSGNPTVQIHNVTNSQDILSTPISIDASENTSYTSTLPPTIDTANDDVLTGNILRVDVDNAGIDAKGLSVILSFQVA